MSGGIDSSVTAMLLKKAGYNVVGVFLHFWSDPTTTITKANKCCSIETMLQARKVADALGIRFYSVDLSEIFKEKVVDYFLKSYELGWTPNPCIMCNRDIKFGAIFDSFKTFDADYWATGHYAKIVDSGKWLVGSGEQERLSSDSTYHLPLTTYHLLVPKDKDKDQTYFLHALTQDKLQKTLFPLGDYVKDEVREMAKELPVQKYGSGYRESQNLCFYAEAEPDAFLERNLPAHLQKPGDIIDATGRVLGRHRGLFHYTMGQRRGIEIAAHKGDGGEVRPYFVTGVDLNSNSLIVGDKQNLFSTSCELLDLTTTRPVSDEELQDLEIKVRYSKTGTRGRVVVSRESVVDSGESKTYPLFPNSPSSIRSGKVADRTAGVFEQNDDSPKNEENIATVASLPRNDKRKYTIQFSEPVRAIARGQSAVIYRGDECLGGGIIVT